MSHDADVIVVGGGLAGLIATRELRGAGLRVLLLEGRDRLGGRAWTRPFADTEVELGGMSVHWFQPHVFAEMTRYGVSHEIPVEPSRWSYLAGGRVHHANPDELMSRLNDLFDRFFPDARETLPLPHQPLAFRDAVAQLDGQSVQDRLDHSDLEPEERELVGAILATACSAPCSESALTAMMRWFALPGWNFGLMLDAVGVYSIRTADLVGAIADDARPEVRVSTPVASIDQRGDVVVVSSRDGASFEADAVVVAVPLNTLAAIRFTPALPPGKQHEAARGQSSRGLKLWAKVRGDVEPFFLMAPDTHPITFLETARVLPDGTHLLCAFGADADRLPPDDETVVRCAVAPLLPAGCEIEAVTAHNWWADEFSQGTWSVFRPGQLRDGLAALQAPHGRVHFAGSDLASGWNGFMDGAIESGLRAGREVAQLLRMSTADRRRHAAVPR
jgi:monoamine oxidase